MHWSSGGTGGMEAMGLYGWMYIGDLAVVVSWVHECAL